MALERRRGITIRAAVVSFDVAGTTVNLVDTPGHSDFIAEVERSLSLLDGAVLVVSAVEGVQAQTLVLMRALQRLGIATVVFVNKVDRAGADPEFVELEVRERLDAELPVLFGSALKGDGVRELLEAFPGLLPGRERSAAGPPGGVVFKIDRDEAGGKEVVALLRVGTLRVRDRLDLGRGRAAARHRPAGVPRRRSGGGHRGGGRPGRGAPRTGRRPHRRRFRAGSGRSGRGVPAAQPGHSRRALRGG